MNHTPRKPIVLTRRGEYVAAALTVLGLWLALVLLMGVLGGIEAGTIHLW